MLTRTRQALTTVRVEQAPRGRVQVGLDASTPPSYPVLRPMLLDATETTARVALVPEGAMLLAGDAIRIEVYVGPGARLALVEPGGTVAYDMRGGSATWDVSIELAAGARLVWHGEPVVSSAGSDVTRRMRVALAPGAVCALRETLVLGRHGEPGGRLRQLLRSDALCEDLELGHPLLLGGRRVMGSITVLGARLGTGMQLESEGTLLRVLCDDAHEAVLRDAWAAVS